MDSDYEEEEILVFADFKNQLLPREIADPNIAVKLIGIESANPIAEINGHIFKGTYDFAMGTNVFFAKDDVSKLSDPLFEETCRQNYKYYNKTTKVINFQRIFVESNKAGNDDDEPPAASTDSSSDAPAPRDPVHLKIDTSYEELIKQFPAHPKKD